MYLNPQNICVFTGRLGKDPEALGKDRMRFSIGVKATKDKTYWPTFYVGGPSMEYVSEYCHKGDLVQVACSYCDWKKKDGTYGYGFEVSSVNKLSVGERESKPKAAQQEEDSNDDAPPFTPTPSKNRPSRPEINDDDVPF